MALGLCGFSFLFSPMAMSTGMVSMNFSTYTVKYKTLIHAY